MKFIKNWQKVCVSQDYFNDEFQYILEKKFNQVPTFHRKQWEFVVIYLNLLKNGKLNKESIGASFGAGRERLIFDVSKVVKEFTATDLYVYNTAWATAKVEKDMSCLDFVLEKAPKNFDDSNLTVKEMDMRDLDFSDNSLDFAYSSCAFEHIGHFDDFVQHLKEVKRTLKEGGVYVMTTEHLFLHETLKMEGNYKFQFSFLMDIFKAADFYPEKSFDAELKRNGLNMPGPDLLPLLGVDQSIQNETKSLIIDRHGIPHTSSCYVFKKGSDTRHVELLGNLEQSSRFFNRVLKQKVKVLFDDVKSIDPRHNLSPQGRSTLSDHIDYLADDFEKQVKLFPQDDSEFVYTDFIYFDDFSFNFTVYLSVESAVEVKVKLIERPQVDFENRTEVKSVTKSINNEAKISINYSANKSCVYALAVSTENGDEIKLHYLDVRARLVSEYEE
ncbi:class I SAM-dependent methyltransferase [Marinicella litoralis]|uniref:Methyltransferase family protein n=1 Tax=Marinicella litoralis TaxID=644220 RepID=A0A4R6XXB2_9GAMM|nr:class I SAM-dependent methyltransferase [Marinicella litoralis]TDR23229.1 methyltransferase family protein [Marinicella litoralis]